MCGTRARLALAALGAALGFSAFVCFCLVYANVEAGVWALLSGIKATLSLVLHLHYFKGSLHANFSRRFLQSLGDFGMIGFVAGLGLTVFYAFLQIYWNNPMLPVNQSLVIRLVWSFMMMKWGMLLYLDTKRYLRTYNDQQLFSESSHIVET